MAHKHSIYDNDPHFIIDAVSKAITTESKKLKLMQGDHNSERFSFELPREIEGHDMSLCNRVEIHYVNTNPSTRETSEDIYTVTDMMISEDDENKVVLTWLIAGSATQYPGTMQFAVRFMCVSGSVIDYEWGTDIFAGIEVGKSIRNSETIAENRIDALEQYRPLIAQYGETLYSEVDEAFKAGRCVSAIKEVQYETKLKEGVYSRDGSLLMSWEDLMTQGQALWAQSGFEGVPTVESDMTAEVNFASVIPQGSYATIVIPEGITRLGKYVFNDYNVRFTYGKIIFPSTLVEIDEYAAFCMPVYYIAIPPSVTVFNNGFGGKTFNEIYYNGNIDLSQNIYNNATYGTKVYSYEEAPPELTGATQGTMHELAYLTQEKDNAYTFHTMQDEVRKTFICTDEGWQTEE